MISGPASERHVVVAALSCETRAASQVPGACKGQSSKVQSKSHKEESVTVPKKKKKNQAGSLFSQDRQPSSSKSARKQVAASLIL